MLLYVKLGRISLYSDFHALHLVTIEIRNLKNRSINDYPNESSFFSGSEFSTLLAESVSRPKLKFINDYESQS